MLITLKNFFEKDNMLEEVGGTEYLVKLTRFSCSSKQAVDYAKIVHENFVKRELIQISQHIKDDTLNSDDDKSSDIIIEDAEKKLGNKIIKKGDRYFSVKKKKEGDFVGCPHRENGVKSDIKGISDIQVKGKKFIGVK